MRHETNSGNHKRRHQRVSEVSSEEEERDVLVYSRKSERINEDEYRQRKKKKHKRHRHEREEENEEVVETYHSRSHYDEEEVVEIHGSSSEEESYARKRNEHRETHRKRHRHKEYYDDEHKLSRRMNHKKKRKEKSDSEEWQSERSERLRQHELLNKVRVKEEVESGLEEYDSHHRHRRKRRHGENEESSRVEVKQEPEEEDDRSRGDEDESSRSRKNETGADRREGNGRVRKSRFASSTGEEKQEWGQKSNQTNSNQPGQKQEPNFGLSGKLAEDTNIYNGVVIKYSEPPEARKPKRRWRLYPFKGDESLPPLYIHRQSAYLMGRDRKVVDIPIDHPSCSKQHAALQYRLVSFKRENGTTGKQIKLYIIDLESANGTFINNKKIEHKKYVELMERDVIKFGFSSREYVLLHEHSKDDDDDDVKPVLDEFDQLN